ncbi:outer membrane beta-barrel protein [candidate division CSSED10-310 bacterium]|uniref:Outer membrane beta-barrel protein n=1 Tax=candidate division CSSED10-310 bacterium TaxID=2855610 RepID=A0ABV6Z1R0_UNCC1
MRTNSLQFVIIGILFYLTGLIVVPVLEAEDETKQSLLNISGFVDTRYFYDLNVEQGSFSLDEFELDFAAELSDMTALQVDLNFREMDSQGDDDSLNFSEIVEQGFIIVKCPTAENREFQFGKFNAPIGFESLDPPEMYQHTHALVFDLGIPTNVTGAQVASSFFNMLDLKLYLVNGWDNNVDNNDELTIGGRLGIRPLEGINIGFSSIYGSETEDVTQDRMVFDIDGSIALFRNLLIGFEWNQGSERKVLPDGEDGQWSGFLVMMNYNLNDHLGFTVRYDMFDDEDGLRTGIKQTVTSYTLTSLITLSKGASILIDYRRDESDEYVFYDKDDDLCKCSQALVLEFLYCFDL